MVQPLAAIVGRPNVGKSSLFNRLVGRREAIVSDLPGTTRDRIMGDVVWGDRAFTLVDTGGLEPQPQDLLRERVKAQVAMAVAEADLIIFLVDAVIGLAPLDYEVAQWLRPFKKPLVLAVNKSDNDKRTMAVAEFHQLGMGEPLPVSAYHNLGIHDLVDQMLSLLPEAEPEPAQDLMRLAIVGRVNVGKSMLLNAILGQERSIVDDRPGTTRDAVDSLFLWDGHEGVIIDTAGIRRRGRVEPGVERYSVLRAIRAVHRSNIALIVLDSTEPVVAQDTHIAGLAWEAHKGVVLVANKWDLVPKKDGLEKELYLQELRAHFHFMPYAPVVFTSALRKEGIDDLLAIAAEVYEERKRRILQGALYNAMMEAVATHPPPSGRGRELRVYSVKQTGVNPTEITFDVNDASLVHFSYRRYLETKLRSAFEFRHTRLKLVFRKSRG